MSIFSNSSMERSPPPKGDKLDYIRRFNGKRTRRGSSSSSDSGEEDENFHFGALIDGERKKLEIVNINFPTSLLSL
jgi:hypothetical protein